MLLGKKLALALTSVLIAAVSVSSGHCQPYEWGQVLIGGGGYVTGIQVHPQNPDLLYIRTDVGGAYRYNKSENRLEQIMNWVPYESENLWGIAGLALDPKDQSTVFVAGCKYSGLTPCDVLESTTGGRSWSALRLNRPFGGNEGSDRFGDPLVVNPHTGELFAGTKGGGLWVFNRQSRSWRQLTGVPAGTSVRNILFHPQSRDTILVTVRGAGVFRSTDGGVSFTSLNAPQTEILDASLTKSGKVMYLASQNGLFKLEDVQASPRWSTITPYPSLAQYRTVRASPHDEGTLITAPGYYGNLRRVAVSYNFGATWSEKSSVEVTQSVPWHPQGYPGSAISSFQWDPTKPNRVFFGDWYSFYVTDDINATTVRWNNSLAKGHEELVGVSLHSPREGSVRLITGAADNSTFFHTNLEQYPSRRELTEQFNEGVGAASNWANSQYVAIAGRNHWTSTEGVFGGIALSSDGGTTFTIASGFDRNWGLPRVALETRRSGIPSILTITSKNGAFVSLNGGSSFQQAVGLPSASTFGISDGIFSYRFLVDADKVREGTFYAYAPGNRTLYRSIDRGVTWSTTATGSSLPSGSASMNVETLPGREGELLISSEGQALVLVTEGGTRVRELTSVRSTVLATTGAPRSSSSNPPLYLYGRIGNDSESWIYRSEDFGTTWERINDEDSRIGNSPQIMRGDQREFGRVYIATNGSGIWASSPRATIPTPRPTAQPTVTPSPTATPTRAPTIAPTIVPTQTPNVVPTLAPTPAPTQTPIVTPTPTVGTRFEAETTVREGCQVEAKFAGFSGSGYIDFIQSRDESIEWTVQSATRATRRLVFTYANGSTQSRPLDVFVNGRKVSRESFGSTEGWTSWKQLRMRTRVTLRAGSNKIKVVSTGRSGANIDYLTVGE